MDIKDVKSTTNSQRGNRRTMEDRMVQFSDGNVVKEMERSANTNPPKKRVKTVGKQVDSRDDKKDMEGAVGNVVASKQDGSFR